MTEVAAFDQEDESDDEEDLQMSESGPVGDWNKGICMQFCQKVGKSHYVNNKCPDHCMKDHPKWKRMKDKKRKKSKHHFHFGKH